MALTAWETTVAVAEKSVTADGATEKQIAFITKLVEEKDPSNLSVVLAKQMLVQIAAHPLTKKQASSIISGLLTVKKKPYVYPPNPFAPPKVGDVVTVSVAPVALGIYDTMPNKPEPEEIPGGGRWIIVYQGKNGKRVKRLYKSWDTKSGFSWKTTSSYWLSRIQKGEAVKVDVEFAKTLSKKIGFCMWCGAFLSDPESIKNGIGPVCAGKYIF